MFNLMNNRRIVHVDELSFIGKKVYLEFSLFLDRVEIKVCRPSFNIIPQNRITINNQNNN